MRKICALKPRNVLIHLAILKFRLIYKKRAYIILKDKLKTGENRIF